MKDDSTYVCDECNEESDDVFAEGLRDGWPTCNRNHIMRLLRTSVDVNQAVSVALAFAPDDVMERVREQFDLGGLRFLVAEVQAT